MHTYGYRRQPEEDVMSYAASVVSVSNSATGGGSGEGSGAGIILPQPRVNVIFNDNFSGNTYSMVDLTVSPNGKWFCDFFGFGQINTRISSDNRPVMHMIPLPQSGPDDTEACKVSTVQDFTNFDLTFSMRTLASTRTGAPPNNWEAAWIMWSNTNRVDLANRSVNHYYFVIKYVGHELGKKDNIESNNNLEDQIFLATDTNDTLTLGKWYNVRIIFNNYRSQIYVDNSLIFDYQDTPNNPTRMAHGSLSLYTEDSNVEFADILVRHL